MSDTTKRRLLYLALAVIIFLLVFWWRKPETAKQVFDQITDPGNFVWPTADTVTPVNYSPGTFIVPPLGGYNSNMPGCGCGMCSDAPSQKTILPASPSLFVNNLAGGSPPLKQIPSKIAFPIKPFGGSQMTVGWS